MGFIKTKGKKKLRDYRKGYWKNKLATALAAYNVLTKPGYNPPGTQSKNITFVSKKFEIPKTVLKRYLGFTSRKINKDNVASKWTTLTQ